jgi:hypothetical protein
MRNGRSQICALILFACGCGGRQSSEGADDFDGAGGSSTGSGGSSRSSGGSAAGSGGASQASGGGATVAACDVIDGQLAYGPIGDPSPVALPQEECAACVWMGNIAGFRTSTGYDLFWQTKLDSDQSIPNLHAMKVSPRFEGGEPLPPLTPNTVTDIQVVPLSDGYLIANCSQTAESGWLRLNAALRVVADPGLAAPDRGEGSCSPPIVWTGQGYLTAFVDERGLVLSSLDERGAVLSEEVLSPGSEEVAVVRFTKNGDRVLVAFTKSGGSFGYGVVDLQGKLLGELGAIRDDDIPMDFQLGTSGDGWIVVTGYGPGVTGVWKTEISADGLAEEEVVVMPGGYIPWVSMTKSAHGGALVLVMRDEGGMSGHTYFDIALIDDVGDAVVVESWDLDDEVPLPRAMITDPERDLIVFQSGDENSANAAFVQEYGCLNQ